MAQTRVSTTIEVSSTESKTTRQNTAVVLQAGNGGLVYTKEFTTTAAAITQTTNAGYLLIKNFDAANYVEWGANDGGTIRVLGRIVAGEFALIKSGGNLLARTASGTALCEVVSIDR